MSNMYLSPHGNSRNPFRLTGSSVLAARSIVGILAVAVAIIAVIGIPRTASAQQPPAAFPPGDVAVIGEPFGVFSIQLPLPQGAVSQGNATDPTPRVFVEEADQRVFYPAILLQMTDVQQREPLPPPRIGRPGGVIDRVRSAIRGEPDVKKVPTGITISGLFQGEAPLTLLISGDVERRVVVRPQPAPPGALSELQSLWWTNYVDAARKSIEGDDTPDLLHKYLVKMLADRLGLPAVDLDPPDPEKKETNQPLETLALLAAIEPLREQILEDVINVPRDRADASLPLPIEPQWEPTLLPAAQNPPAFEALATRVPAECFYLRFGSFTNYVWFQEIGERYGGEIGQAVVLRGFNYEAAARMERMLATKLTAVAKMFGDKLISDMAIVGSDLYMKEGASLGVLFQASNSTLLSANMESDRRAVLAKNPDATLQKVVIADREVSLLSTPDNRIRSFYLVDDQYLFLTTSYTLMQRFIEVSTGKPSLADTPEFQWARTWMPEQNNYSVFGYFSNDFFHRLVSPQYQIELRRRLEAIAHLEVAAVASRVASSEGVAPDSIAQLQNAGLLPEWFDNRPDGARVLRDGDRWVDSLRGARGSFLPIADVPIEQVTERESEEYANLANFYLGEWRHMDPILIGVRRFAVEGKPNTERVAFEGYVAPFEAEKYGWIARQLAAPTGVEMNLPADDALSVQLHMRGNSGLLAAPDDYHLFGGVKDMVPPAPEDTKGLIKTLRALKTVPAYIGGWPKPGLIEQLPLGIGLAPVDYAGFSRMIGGLWRWQGSDISLLSFDRSILDQAIPQIAPVQTDDLAQARVRIADLRGSKLAGWINGQWYQRGWQASQGNARFLDDVHQQLRVPGENCLAEAEEILDVRIQCPLGGEYQFVRPTQNQGGQWLSTAWTRAGVDARGNPLPPNDYSAPWLEWFQGGRIHVTQQPQSLSIVGDVQLELQPLRVSAEEGAEAGLLPPMNLDLFSLPMKLFGGSEKKDPATAPGGSKRQKF